MYLYGSHRRPRYTVLDLNNTVDVGIRFCHVGEGKVYKQVVL